MIQAHLLHQISLFAPLSPETLEWLGQHTALHEYGKQEQVIGKNEPSTELLFLIKGRLLVMDVAQDGQEVGLHIIQPGDYFGELSAIDGLPRAASVRAMEPSVVGKLSRECFQQLMSMAPSVTRAMLDRFALVIRANNKRRVILSINNVQRRVAALLLSYSTPEAGGRKALVIRQLPTQHELAAMANTSRESVSRVLRSLMEQGLIVREGRALVIPDPSAMDRLIQNAQRGAEDSGK
ncbi:Crp/Fnr family transcriptional regulator [Gulbenkiania mobilis]|uniref:CRP-like cAMP-binding protein n=1 Tax=Gulbenkiania mobilis TaxID=397457 RepID=A0ABY2CZ57_GULMO|nr:CRP-like cAMP-binding protein [Gulbenkiania mobilis]